MRKQSIIWLVISASLVLLGTIVFGGAMMALGWDFSKLSTSEFETNYYDVDNIFSDISVLADTADISFALAVDKKCSVVCHENTRSKHLVSVKDGTLSIELQHSRKWYDYIGIFNFDTPNITVYLPSGRYGELSVEASTGDVEIPDDFIFNSICVSLSTGDVTNNASVSDDINIKTSTGNIKVANVSAGGLDLSVSTGKITVSNVTCTGDVNISVSTGKSDITDLECSNLGSTGNTGDISMKNVVASGKFSIERTTGDVKFDACDASEISVKTDTGDVTGSLLTDKVFITETDTGNVVVPESVAGGKCKIFTDTGDIKMEIV